MDPNKVQETIESVNMMCKYAYQKHMSKLQ